MVAEHPWEEYYIENVQERMHCPSMQKGIKMTVPSSRFVLSALELGVIQVIPICIVLLAFPYIQFDYQKFILLFLACVGGLSAAVFRALKY